MEQVPDLGLRWHLGVPAVADSHRYRAQRDAQGQGVRRQGMPRAHRAGVRRLEGIKMFRELLQKD
jgi:hypothetical protein